MTTGSPREDNPEPDEIPHWFKKLLASYYEQLLSFSRYIAGESLDPRDLLHEACRNASESYHQLEERDNFDSWMRSIIVNMNRDLHRQSTPEASTEDLYYLEDDSSDSTGRHTAHLFRLLSELPVEQREALLLKEYAGLQISEIATIQKANENTVKSRIHLAKGKLENCIKPEGGG